MARLRDIADPRLVQTFPHGNQLLVKIDGIFDNFYAKYAKTKSCEKSLQFSVNLV